MSFDFAWVFVIAVGVGSLLLFMNGGGNDKPSNNQEQRPHATANTAAAAAAAPASSSSGAVPSSSNVAPSSSAASSSSSAPGIKHTFSGCKVLANSHIFLNNESSSFEVNLDRLPSLSLLASTSDLYLVAQVSSDEEEVLIRSALEKAAIPGLNPVKILFCSTPRGKGSMARQIEPALYLDNDVEQLNSLKPFVRSLHVSLSSSPASSKEAVVRPAGLDNAIPSVSGEALQDFLLSGSR